MSHLRDRFTLDRKGQRQMNVNKLKAKCVEKGINIDTLSKDVDIPISTFYRKLKENSFTVEEANRIVLVLDLNEREILDIFFEISVA